MAVTLDDQFEIGTGTPLLMGPATYYDIQTVDGLFLPPVRTADIDKVGDGVVAARDTVGPRTISIDLEIFGTPGSDLIGKCLTFATAWQSTNTDVTLTYKLPGFTTNRYVNGRPRRCAGQWNLAADTGVVKVAVDFFCEDPRIFLAGGTTVTVF